MPERSPATLRESSADWPVQAADFIVDTVEKVRDKTTGKVEVAARGIVYGLIGALLGGVIALLLAIALVRLLVAYLPDSVFGEEHVWAAHLLTGLLFLLPGMLLWRKRRPHRDDDDG